MTKKKLLFSKLAIWGLFIVGVLLIVSAFVDFSDELEGRGTFFFVNDVIGGVFFVISALFGLYFFKKQKNIKSNHDESGNESIERISNE